MSLDVLLSSIKVFYWNLKNRAPGSRVSVWDQRRFEAHFHWRSSLYVGPMHNQYNIEKPSIHTLVWCGILQMEIIFPHHTNVWMLAEGEVVLMISQRLKTMSLVPKRHRLVSKQFVNLTTQVTLKFSYVLTSLFEAT
ncbi:hypothetical protein AVEN_115237-1 [Araneus ventricosus]|uniref:Uncharacterized protein n=1 Tax=Araneus ventricosus TaxID=182803 RepID=A0A4Y1ZYZ0_ARAVE|nr:hypothetical protein AVEN_115237-1 [Araneus ventricosus]